MITLTNVHQRSVLCKRQTRQEAFDALDEWCQTHPARRSRLAVEYTPSPNARACWRVVSLTPLKLDVADCHAGSERLRQEQRESIHEMWAW